MILMKIRIGKYLVYLDDNDFLRTNEHELNWMISEKKYARIYCF